MISNKTYLEFNLNKLKELVFQSEARAKSLGQNPKEETFWGKENYRSYLNYIRDLEDLIDLPGEMKNKEYIEIFKSAAQLAKNFQQNIKCKLAYYGLNTLVNEVRGYKDKSAFPSFEKADGLIYNTVVDLIRGFELDNETAEIFLAVEKKLSKQLESKKHTDSQLQTIFLSYSYPPAQQQTRPYPPVKTAYARSNFVKNYIDSELVVYSEYLEVYCRNKRVHVANPEDFQQLKTQLKAYCSSPKADVLSLCNELFKKLFAEVKEAVSSRITTSLAQKMAGNQAKIELEQRENDAINNQDLSNLTSAPESDEIPLMCGHRFHRDWQKGNVLDEFGFSTILEREAYLDRETKRLGVGDNEQHDSVSLSSKPPSKKQVSFLLPKP